MVMHTITCETNETRRVRRHVREVDANLATALRRPAQAHWIEEVQRKVVVHWESNATSGCYEDWETIEFNRVFE